MAYMANTKLKIGEVLIENGDITEEQLLEALAVQKQSEKKQRLGEVLISCGMVTESKMLLALAKRLNLEFVQISERPIDIEAVSKVPQAVANKYCLIPAQMKDSTLTILMNDPLDYYAIEDIKFITNMQIEVLVAKKEEIIRAINENYSEIHAQKVAVEANVTAEETTSFGHVDISENSTDAPVVALVNSILYKAYSTGASDIHIEPFEETINVRIRVDGLIVNYLTLARSLHSGMVARIKILSLLDIAEKRLPQDGHFRAKLNDIDINVRVSTLPTVYGEKIVLRFMSQNTTLDHSGTLGMQKENYEKVLKMMQVPYGLIYITGPTGSGKTTTLYMMMEMLTKKKVSIATVEDPVEKNLKDINQTQINTVAGLTFEMGLRAILRQDPDIIMIGETRDNETASISVRAALTGHLVLSTLHTNDSISAVMRLIDMGVEDYLLASSLAGVVAQRLVKKICPHCKAVYTPTEIEKSSVEHLHIDTFYHGAGCHNCNNTGYRGRIAVHEVLVIDTAIRNFISQKAPMEDIYAYVKREGKLKTLQDSVLELVEEGTTTIEEMMKLTYMVD